MHRVASGQRLGDPLEGFWPVLVAPTSISAKPASFRPEVEIAGTLTKVLVEQMGAVDADRFGGIAGHLSAQEQWGVDTAVLTVLGLN